MIVRSGDIREQSWALVSMADGQTLQDLTFAADQRTMSVIFLDNADGTVVIEAMGENMLYGIGESGQLWQRGLPTNANVITMDGHIGVSSGLDDNAFIVDSLTGEVTTSFAPNDYSTVIWASDGYVANADQTNPEYVYYDVDGNEVSRVTEDTYRELTPDARAGITYSIADIEAAAGVDAVDAEGQPVVYAARPGYGPHYTSGAELDIDGIVSLYLHGVSADGNLIAITPESDSGTSEIRDVEGELISSYALNSGYVSVMGGYLVVQERYTYSTYILLPHRF